jgi:hypothetical protein
MGELLVLGESDAFSISFRSVFIGFGCTYYLGKFCPALQKKAQQREKASAFRD